MTLSKDEKQMLRHALHLFELRLTPEDYTSEDLRAYVTGKRKVVGSSPLDEHIEDMINPTRPLARHSKAIA